MMSSQLPLRRRDKNFYTWTGARPAVNVHGRVMRPPFFYHRADAFQSIHLASFDAVQGILPSADLHPIRWFDGRALVGIGVFRYEHVSYEDAEGTTKLLAPYGEISVVALVSRTKPRLRGLGMLQAALVGGGTFILDLPVTTKQARDGGRSIYGMPKFVADMDFSEEPGRRKVVLSEENAHILTVEVRVGGPVMADHAPLMTYSVKDGKLIETRSRFLGHRQTGMGASSGSLALGEHPVSDRLRALDVATEPLAVSSYLDARLILPTGTPVGPAHEYVGYLGQDRERGRLTVSYPGTGPIDLYEVPGGLRPGMDMVDTGLSEVAHA